MKHVAGRRIIANGPAVLFTSIGTDALDQMASDVIATIGNQFDDSRLAYAAIADDGIDELGEVGSVGQGRGDIDAVARPAGEQPFPVLLTTNRPTRRTSQVFLVESHNGPQLDSAQRPDDDGIGRRWR